VAGGADIHRDLVFPHDVAGVVDVGHRVQPERHMMKTPRLIAQHKGDVVGLVGAAEKNRELHAAVVIDELFAQMFSNPAWQYTHKWRDGDFVFWDNACLNHMAGGGYDYPDTRRMHRTTIAGPRPFYRAA
jgi:taurine dioxygenase